MNWVTAPFFGLWWSASELSWHLWVCRLVCWCVVVVVQSLSPIWPFVTPWTVALQASLTFTVCWSLLKLMSIESVMPSTISFFVAPFSFCLQSFPLLGSFAMSWLFASDDQSVGTSASASVLLANNQDLFPLGLTGLIFPLSKGFLRICSSNAVWKHQLSCAFMVELSYSYVTTGKTIALTICAFVGKVMSLLFNTLSRLVTAFLPRSKCLFHGYSHCPQSIWNSRKKKCLSLLPHFPLLFVMKWWDRIPWS